jgi:hypothetical protein
VEEPELNIHLSWTKRTKLKQELMLRMPGMMFIYSPSLPFYGPPVLPRKHSTIISHWCKCLVPLPCSTWTMLTPLVGLPMRTPTWPWIPTFMLLSFFLQPSPVRSLGDYEGGHVSMSSFLFFYQPEPIKLVAIKNY